jgi:predicted dehydrogenase
MTITERYGTVRWGILGAGRITASTVPDLRRVDGFEVVAVAGRTGAGAAELAASIPNAMATDLETVLGDASIDAVYVATPFATHAQIVRAALESGKHVVVEKPMSMSASEVTDLFALAAERGLFLMEGMWMKFNPVHDRVTALIDSGAIGEVRSLRAGFGFPRPDDGGSRWDVRRNGSTVLDQGIYAVALAHSVLGEPASVAGRSVIRADDGLDLAGHFTLDYHDGRFAHGAHSMLEFVDPSATINGTAGWITIPGMFWAAKAVELHNEGWDRMFERPERIDLPWNGNGYVPMFEAVRTALAAGWLQHPVHDAEQTIAVFRTLDALRRLPATSA